MLGNIFFELYKIKNHAFFIRLPFQHDRKPVCMAMEVLAFSVIVY